MPAKIKFKKIEIQERDRKILQFIWRWKVVTGPWIHSIFFAKDSGRNTVKHLSRLRAAGLISNNGIDAYKIRYWQITAKGIDLILDEVGPLESKVAISEAPIHDLICSAVQLGQWQYKAPEGAGLLTEQQLRSCVRSTLPDWVPNDVYHRPDGYWLCGWEEKKVVVGLEVELNPKSKNLYFETLNQYGMSESIDYVVWVTGRRLIAERINSFSKAMGSRFSKKMIVLDLKDVIKLGWCAPIRSENRSHATLHSLLHPRGYIGDILIYPQYNFDTRLFPVNSTEYKLNENLLCIY